MDASQNCPKSSKLESFSGCSKSYASDTTSNCLKTRTPRSKTPAGNSLNLESLVQELTRAEAVVRWNLDKIRCLEVVPENKERYRTLRSDFIKLSEHRQRINLQVTAALHTRHRLWQQCLHEK